MPQIPRVALHWPSLDDEIELLVDMGKPATLFTAFLKPFTEKTHLNLAWYRLPELPVISSGLYSAYSEWFPSISRLHVSTRIFADLETLAFGALRDGSQRRCLIYFSRPSSGWQVLSLKMLVGRDALTQQAQDLMQNVKLLNNNPRIDYADKPLLFCAGRVRDDLRSSSDFAIIGRDSIADMSGDYDKFVQGLGKNPASQGMYDAEVLGLYFMSFITAEAVWIAASHSPCDGCMTTYDAYHALTSNTVKLISAAYQPEPPPSPPLRYNGNTRSQVQIWLGISKDRVRGQKVSAVGVNGGDVYF